MLTQNVPCIECFTHLVISLNFLPLLTTFIGVVLVQYLHFWSQH